MCVVLNKWASSGGWGVEWDWENEAYESVHYFADSEAFEIQIDCVEPDEKGVSMSYVLCT
jgi:hypothetical protein